MNKKLLTKKQAIDFLGLKEKVFNNYFSSAKEFFPVKRRNDRGRFFFDKDHLQKWKESYNWRTVILDREDYNLCLDFALAMHFRGYVLSDWGTARQREFGQKLTNWIKGQLGEVAVKNFFKREFNLNVEIDFNIYSQIVPQDITAVIINGKKRQPKIGIGIKSSKPKNTALVLGANEIEIPERSSDIYIFCRPDLPDDHLLRIAIDEVIKSVKNKPHYGLYKKLIPKFADMSTEITGFCYKKELEKVTEIPGQKFDNGHRYVRFSGDLRRDKKDWKELISRL